MNKPPPDIGTVENGYRYKGGDPAQESSWEQVGVVDVSAEYGAGARQLPNGTIERIGPRGGVTKIASASSGVGDALVGADARARFMLGIGPLTQAQNNFRDLEEGGRNPLNQNWGAALIDQATEVPFLRNIGDAAAKAWGGEDYQRYAQAVASYESALMPIMSGAAVTPSEAQRLIRADLPQLGDSEEVLRRKAANREMRINGVAQGIGQEAPFLPVVADGRDGMPSYPSIERLTRDAHEFPMPEGGYGPRPGDVRVTQEALAPEDTPESLRAQGYVYDPARDIWSRTRQEQVPMSAEQAVEDRRGLNGFVRRADAVARGAADMLSFGFADEAAAIGDSIIPLSRGSRSLWSDGFEDAFAHNLAMQRGGDAADRTDVPVSRMAGQGLGVGLGVGAALSKTGAKLASGLPSFLRAEAKPTGATRAIPEIMRRGRNAARAGLFGGGGAALAAAGENEGNIPERLAAGARAAPLGAILGTAAGPAVEAIARPVGLFGRRVMNRVSSLDDLVRRMSIPADAAEQAALMRSQGLSPTITDLADDAGRGQLRALATRQTPARQAARDFSEGRANDLQDRLSVQARRNVSDDPRSPLQMREEITRRRSAEADAAFGAVRNEAVQPERGVIEALRAPATRSAIEEAATAALNHGDGATANALRQLVDGALDDPNGVQLTVGMADRISRSLNGRAEALQRGGNNDAASAYFSLAQQLRGTARQQVPGYDSALRSYAADSGLADAIDLGERFLSMEADEFAAAAARLSPDERAVAQAAARRAIERAGGTQGAAPGVARRLSGGREQQARNAALLDDPQTFQQAVGMEHQAVQNAGAINPMRGSPTAPSMQDAMKMAGEAIGTAQDVVGGNVPGLMSRVASSFKTMGFNDQEAEMVVMAAIDPAQTDRILQILAQSVGPERAQRAVMAAKYAMIQNTGEGVGSQGQ